MLNDLDMLPNKNNWASLVRNLLMSLGFYDVWLEQGVENYKGFMTVLRQRLTNNFVQNWHSRLEDSSRAVFYNSIASFQFQPYLENVNEYEFCNAISRLRLSSHRLEVEAGRWVRINNVQANERKCTLCNVMEDKYHFVMECQRYTELRKKYLSKYYLQRPSMFKFVDLIHSNNIKYIKNLGTFVYHAFKLRSDMLYLTKVSNVRNALILV